MASKSSGKETIEVFEGGPREIPSTITIIGTGDFARALAKRLLEKGFHVVFGSRNPNMKSILAIDPSLQGAEVKTISEAIEQSPVVVMATHMCYHAQILKPLEMKLLGKIIIDVSNPERIQKGASNAEQLNMLLPGSFTIKAFNTISAYKLSDGKNAGSEDVYVCGNEAAPRALVLQMAREMGFNGVDYGGLSKSSEVEHMPLHLFPEWRTPLFFSMILFVLWAIYGIFRYHYYKPNPYDWNRLPLNVINKVFACTAITLLALTFIPGSIAAMVQLINGTKYRRFPQWLDGWMKMRKHIGLISLFMIMIHCIMSLALSSNAYFSWYTTRTITIPFNQTEDIVIPVETRMNWKGETAYTMGTLAFFCMFLLGLTSIPAIGGRLNWREWNFIQSGFGYTAIVLATTHVMLKGAYKWGYTPFLATVQGMSFICLWLPVLALFLKLLVTLPCISIYVNKIRRGHERGVESKIQNIEAMTQGKLALDNPGFELKSTATI